MKKKLLPLFKSANSDDRNMAVALLDALPEKERSEFFSGAQLNDQGQITGDLPWSSSLINAFLAQHPRRLDIISLDLSHFHEE